MGQAQFCFILLTSHTVELFILNLVPQPGSILLPLQVWRPGESSELDLLQWLGTGGWKSCEPGSAPSCLPHSSQRKGKAGEGAFLLKHTPFTATSASAPGFRHSPFSHGLCIRAVKSAQSLHWERKLF